jgi:drug/metabolite transporter (DMT)-like permease
LKNTIPALLAALAANMIYGVNYVVAKGIMPDFMQPRAIIFIRVLGAALVFWIVQLPMKKEKVSKTDLGKIAIAALFGVAINQIMFFEGLNLSTPINVSIIMVCVPIAVLVFSHFIRGEKLTHIRIAGIGLGTAGAAMLILGGGAMNLSSETALGNFLIVINASSYALYLVLIKPIMMKYNPLTVMKWVFLFGLIGVTPFTLHVFLRSDFIAIPQHIWFSIGYVVLFTTILAYFLNNYSLTRISPTANSAFIYLQPVFTSIIAVIFAKDQFSVQFILPVMLTFTGVYLVSIKRNQITRRSIHLK